jgi:CRISPR-associated protein Cmr1
MRPGPIILKIKTPVWTGDIDSKSELLQSTGITGSLRWWTEVILRGLDKFACDPVEDDRCPKKVKKNNLEMNEYCPACLIFGATGRRRTFRLHMNGGEETFNSTPIKIQPDNRKGGWYLGSGLKGEVNLEVTPLDKGFKGCLVLIPLTIAAKWGGLGAKTQHGYGVVGLAGRVGFEDFKKALDALCDGGQLKRLGMAERTGDNNSLPDIKEMFFAKVRFEAQGNWWKGVDGIKRRGQKGNSDYYGGYESDPRMISWANSDSVPIAPAIKNWLRFGDGKGLWQTGNNRELENWLFGTTKRICSECLTEVGKDKKNKDNFWCPHCKKSFKPKDTLERVASKINVSCAYCVNANLWEFRIWGWVPKNNLSSMFNREGFLDNLKACLSGSGQVQIPFPWNRLLGGNTKGHSLKVWREFNSPRDTVKAQEPQIAVYLQSLLDGEEAGR